MKAKLLTKFLSRGHQMPINPTPQNRPEWQNSTISPNINQNTFQNPSPTLFQNQAPEK